jgi:quercetin dioxygenase-like cupin family protein
MTQSEYFPDPAKAPKFTMIPGAETAILTALDGEGMMMVLTEIAPGVTVPVHSHPHQQMGMVYSGKAEMRIGDQVRTIARGDICVMPSNVEHGATSVGDEPFVMLDIFYPAREDYLKKIGS